MSESKNPSSTASSNNDIDDSSDLDMMADDNDDTQTVATTTTTFKELTFRLPFMTWSRQRVLHCLLGCTSSSLVLAIRLLLDNGPLVYVIHSVIVFLDMVLIHLFTNCRWLSISGEIITIAMFLSYHFTKETVFELFETTFIAMLCSFHMIASRNKAKIEVEKLEHEIEDIRSRSESLLKHAGRDLEGGIRGLANVLEQHKAESTRRQRRGSSWLKIEDEHKRKIKGCCENFFEHFLDGSAGVMYTSFLGLIISELVTYGEKKDY